MLSIKLSNNSISVLISDDAKEEKEEEKRRSAGKVIDVNPPRGDELVVSQLRGGEGNLGFFTLQGLGWVELFACLASFCINA